MTQHTSDIRTETILIVDDEPFFRRVIRDILEQESFTVVEASAGAEVEAMITRYPVATVLTDIEMPGMSGPDVLQLIKQLQPDLPVIMISSHQDFDVARQVLRDGALDYLVKPFPDRELITAVERAVKVFNRSAEARRHREDSERRFADLVLLREVGETASGEADFDSLLQRILDFVTEAVKVKTASLMLAEEEGFLTICASRGLPEKVVTGKKVPLGDSVAGHVYATGEPVLLTNVGEDGRFAPSGDEGQYSTGSALSLPLKGRDRVLGVLNVNNKLDGGTFSAADQYLLASVTHQATLAIENLDLVNRLKAEARRLDGLNRVRTRLVCNLSHELRTPLTTVIGFSDLLLEHREVVSEEDLVEYLGKIQDGSLKMERLINEMLMLFTLESGTASWHLEGIDLNRLFADLVDEYAEEVAELKLSSNVWVSPRLPELNNDSEKLRAVLSSLVDNAIKFNRPGGLLSISADFVPAATDRVRIRIYNDGEPIPGEAAEEIFLPYNQLGDINTDKPTGLGIGLTLCKAVAEAMQGAVSLEPPGEEGTAFYLDLPIDCSHLQKESHDN